MGDAVVALVCGAGFGVGLLLVVLGLRGVWRSPGELLPGGWSPPDRLRLRAGLAVGAAVALFALTGWPAAALFAAIAGFAAPTLVGAERRRREEVARIEAIAAWAEQLRDTIGASAGLQEAIAVTARVAPVEIRPAVQELAAGLRRAPLADQLRAFAHRIDDPTADQIVVALIMASERRGRHLGRLLGEVAAAGRDDVTMRVRTETSRAQVYSDAKVVSGIVVGMFAFLLLFNRTYLEAFDRLDGQLVLAAIGSLWIAALWGIARLSVIRRPPRILAPAATGDAGRGAGSGGARPPSPGRPVGVTRWGVG